MAADVISLIEQDHREMEALFARVGSGEGDRRALLVEIAGRLDAHARAEELEVYPAIAKNRPAAEPGIQHAEHEHHEAEHLLRKARNLVDTAHFDEAFTAFVAAVKHHVEEEETEVLPALRAAVDEETLLRIGMAFEEARQGLLGEPEPADPLTGATRDELYERAKAADIPGRSGMTKDELAQALRDAPG
jgi:hemerythrin superfamily protein